MRARNITFNVFKLIMMMSYGRFNIFPSLEKTKQRTDRQKHGGR